MKKILDYIRSCKIIYPEMKEVTASLPVVCEIQKL